MSPPKLILILAIFAPNAICQLTVDQKVADFMQLAGLYAKNYAPYEWKRDVMGFDLYDVKPWLDRVRASNDDLEFYDICVRYVASLQDSHDEYTLPSDFFASLPFDVDIFDGKVLIDSITRALLPRADYPFNIGDELISVDGKTAAELIELYKPYAANGSGNPSTRRRLAANTITFRQQSFFPRAHEIGEAAVIVVQDLNGVQSTYRIPWVKFGTPITHAGPVPSPHTSGVAIPARKLRFARHSGRELDDYTPNPWGVWTGDPPASEAEVIPAYLTTLHELQVSEAFDPLGSAGFGSRTPAYNPPPGFQTRLGTRQADLFLSGTFQVRGHNVGLIRIPTMSPSNMTTALQQFAAEIEYFQANTEALVIDVMRNGGGSLCYIESLGKYLFPAPFRGAAYEIRATQFWVQLFSGQLKSAISSRADQWVIDLYSAYLSQVQGALNQNRGLTGSVPICTPNFEDIQPATDKDGKLLAYTKPILLLVDEFSLSAAESFSMFLQDSGRATVLGVRTDGGGGNPGSYPAGVYSEGNTRVTRTFVTRPKPVLTPGFPEANHMENVGVYPDILVDYMTRDNLMNGGRAFVQAFTEAVANLF